MLPERISKEPFAPVVRRDPEWETGFAVLALGVLGVMLGLFLFRREPAGPDRAPAVAIVAASLALALLGLRLIAGISLLSSLLANIPVVAASITMVKGYLVAAAIVPETALAAHFVDWPAATVPVFVAMMFGATLGGNATLIGASANVVTTGICARNGRPVRFATWLRYGVPLTTCQLVVAALHVLALFRLLR